MLCGTIGAEFVRRDPFRHEAPTFHQLEQKPLCGALVSFRLVNFLDNNPVLVDRAPQPVWASRDLRSDFAQMPGRQVQSGAEKSPVLGDIDRGDISGSRVLNAPMTQDYHRGDK